jgi:hypothetical protein
MADVVILQVVRVRIVGDHRVPLIEADAHDERVRFGRLV